jgi:phage gpG-like protein
LKDPNAGHIPLFDTGTLYGSIQYDLLPSGDEVAVGHSTFYGIFQDLGTSTIPARSFVGLKDSDLPGMADAVYSFCEDVTSGPGHGFISMV